MVPLRRLLDRRRLRRGSTLLLPFCFLLPLLVGYALAHCDLVECAPFGLHPYVGIARRHRSRKSPPHLRPWRDDGHAKAPAHLQRAAATELAGARVPLKAATAHPVAAAEIHWS